MEFRSVAKVSSGKSSSDNLCAADESSASMANEHGDQADALDDDQEKRLYFLADSLYLAYTYSSNCVPSILFCCSADPVTVEIIKNTARAVGSLSDTEFDIRFNPDCYCETVQHADVGILLV